MFYRWTVVSTKPAVNGKVLYLPIEVVEFLLVTKQKLKVDDAEYTVKNAKMHVESVGGGLEDDSILELT